MKVRVVEDDPGVAGWLVLYLAAEGFQVENGRYRDILRPEVWEGVDVALVDVDLPTLSGYEVIAWLREHFPRIRIVVLSGHDVDADAADAVLRKPLDPDDIGKAIRG